MSTQEELLAAVTSNPEDDAPRLAYAEFIRTWEPARAAFIEEQLAEATERRRRREVSRRGKSGLLRQHETEWARTIARYARNWNFDRGFVTEVWLDPHLFLEYGEWLFINAPIRSVNFVMPEDGPFPMNELAASPLLERLDAIGLAIDDPAPTDNDLLELAASPYLPRLLWLSANRKHLPLSVYEAFAVAPMTRKALSLKLSKEGFPGEPYGDTGRDDWWGGAIFDWLEMRPEGAELEKKYGYVPWIHSKENFCDPFDAAYYVAQGVLPAKPVGS